MEPISGTPTQTIDAEVDVVLQESLRVATDYLTRFDTFIPFAIVYRDDDQVERLEVEPGDASVDVRPQHAYPALVATLAERGESLRAVGIVSDVRLSKDDEEAGDAVQIELEHRDTAARAVAAWVTYERDGSGPPTFAEELGTRDGARRIWV